VATPSRHTFSGTVVACLVAASAGIGWVPAATAVDVATSAELAAPQSCPPSWPALHAGPPAGTFDGNVSVLAGGSLWVAGAASGAEGTVVALGDATFARDVPGSYGLGVTTALGSQVSPYAGSDMLVSGGNVTTAAGTHVDVGQGLGGDVVAAGAVPDGTDLDMSGGTADQAIPDATVPYLDLASQLAPKSAAYAALPDTGTVQATGHELTLVGDGVSNPQVFSVDGATLGLQGESGRALQLQGVPQDAAVIVNLTGPAVDLDVDSLLSPEGLVVDPLTDPYFATLATHLLWNAPAAATVDVGGLAELPGSLLVPTAPSTTTLAGVGVNGRVMVGGDLVQTGTNEIHAYPFAPDADLACGPDLVHLTTLTLELRLVDPDNVVDRDRLFQGRFTCTLGGVDVTPLESTWKLRTSPIARVLSTQIPSGAVCTVTERLDGTPAPFHTWAEPVLQPDSVVVEKRRQRGLVLTNRVKEQPAPPATPTSTPTPTPTAHPTEEPTQEPSSLPSSPPPAEPSASPTPSSVVEPTNRPGLSSSPSDEPSSAPSAASSESSATEAPVAEPPRQSGPAGPLTTTAPFTLRGAFVWGPLLMLSLLTLLLKVRRRPKRLH
jgi:choice-of-anchor A domain-containing protein